MNDITPAQAARFVLDKWLPSYRFWAKDQYASERGMHMCLGTALALASGTDQAVMLSDNRTCNISLRQVPLKILLAAAKIIQDEYPDRVGHLATKIVRTPAIAEQVIIQFNDDEATRFADVQRVMEKMAAA